MLLIKGEGSKGRGSPPQLRGRLAQLEERLVCNQKAGGSNPPASTLPLIVERRVRFDTLFTLVVRCRALAPASTIPYGLETHFSSNSIWFFIPSYYTLCMNQGERDEIIFKLATAKLTPGLIRNPGGQIPNASAISSPSSLSQLNDRQLSNLADSVGLGKAPGGSKADCQVKISDNWKGLSLKSTRGASATILNHTHRRGVLAAACRIGYDLKTLDMCIEKYHQLRSQGLIHEDVANTNPNSPFAQYCHELTPIVQYFLTTGTGRGDSPYPSSYVGLIKDPFDGIAGAEIYDATDYISENWDKFRFSMRNKNPSDSSECQPWNVEHDGKIRGELHIRFV